MSNVLNYFDQPADDNDNVFVVGGTVQLNATEFSAEKLENVCKTNDVTVVSANGALAISGYSVVVGGAGLASLTLAAPEPGVLCTIIIRSTSGNVVVTTATGVTFDGTNNTATFNAAADKLVLGYASATQWVVVENVSVTLSAV